MSMEVKDGMIFGDLDPKHSPRGKVSSGTAEEMIL
jgi:hypothetical protein